MTETGSTVERLRGLQDELDAAKSDPNRKPGHWGSEELARDTAAGNALPALLAVVEAAQAVSDYPNQDIPFVLLSDLDAALERLHSQASDEGKT